MSEDMGEMFNALRKMRQEKRASNREYSPKILEDAGYEFASNNNGAHLIVPTKQGMVDFWPGTGKFIIRATQKSGRGVRNLIKIGKPE